jgi:hypothetical protein
MRHIVVLLICVAFGIGFLWLIFQVRRSCTLCAGDVDRTSGVCSQCGFDPRARPPHTQEARPDMAGK